MARDRLDELQNRVFELAQGRGCAEELVADIRRDIRATRGDLAAVIQLRLLLGELFYWTNEPAKSRAQYRRVLKDDPDSVQAMIGIGCSFENTERLTTARKWLEAAYLAAERRQDPAGKLRALDRIALNAYWRRDEAALLDALQEMRCIVASAPPMPDMYLTTPEVLLNKRKGAVTLSLLGCLIKHLLEKGPTPGALVLALRPFIQIHRMENRSEEEIAEVLSKLRLVAADESVAEIFDRASGLALQRNNYAHLQQSETLYDDE